MTSHLTRLYRHKHNENCPLKDEKWINIYIVFGIRHALKHLITLTCLHNTKSRLHNRRRCWKSFRRFISSYYLVRVLDSGSFVALAVSDSNIYLWVYLSLCVFCLTLGLCRRLPLNLMFPVNTSTAWWWVIFGSRRPQHLIQVSPLPQIHLCQGPVAIIGP